MVFAFVVVGCYGTKVTDLLKHVYFWRGIDGDYSMFF